MNADIIEHDGTAQRRIGPVKVAIQSVYLYMILRPPHICTDISVDAELARDGY